MGGVTLKYTLTRNIKTPVLHSKENIITQVHKDFINLSGHSSDDLIGKTLTEVSFILKMNSQINLKNIEDEHTCYIFTKTLEPKEVSISCKSLKCSNEKVYYFNEKRNSVHKNMWESISSFSFEDEGAIAIYSADKLILLKANEKYLNKSCFQFNQNEIVIGKTLREASSKYNINVFENILLEVKKTGKLCIIDEFKYEVPGKEATYWTVQLLPIVISGKVKYIIHTAHNVTQRVLNRKLVEERKDLLEIVIQNISNGVLICDKEGNSILGNTDLIQCYSFNEITKVNDIYKYQKYFDILGNEVSHENIPMARALKGEKIKNQTMIINAKGDKNIVQINATPIYDSHDSIIGGAVFSNNITELYNKEKTIREQKEELEAIVENMSDGLIIINREGKITTANKLARHILSISSEGNSVKEVYDKLEIIDTDMNLLEYEKLPCRKVMSGENVFGERFAIKQTDKVIHIESNGTPVYDNEGNFIAAVMCLRDVTKNIKLQELELIKIQYDLSNDIIENLTLPYVRFSYPDFKTKYINAKSYENLMKINPNAGDLYSLIGENIFDVYEFSIDQKEEFKIGIKNLIDQKSSSFSLNSTFVMLGEKRFFKFLFQPLFGLNNKLTELVSIAIDITEEVNAKNNIEKTLRAQEEILSNISHELKTPLNLIFSTNQLMEMYLKNGSLEGNNDKISKSIGIIKQNCYRFMKLINNIIDMSKIDSGFFTASLTNENIVGVIEDIVQSVSEHISGTGITITFDTNTEEKVIACNPNIIERVMLNLISNAVKFTNSGGSIFVNLIDKGETVEIYVEDTGIGIYKKHLDDIFKSFHQVDKSLSRNSEGIGIGLTIAKLLIEMHGGEITVDSKVGKGTVFKIELPAIIVEEDEVAADIIRPVVDKIEMINIEFSDIYSI